MFFYIDRWSSVFTWGGEAPPSKGQLAVIEEDQTILLDESTEVLKMLLIKGTRLTLVCFTIPSPTLHVKMEGRSPRQDCEVCVIICVILNNSTLALNT